MAGKFTIFCDDCPRSTFEPEDKPIAQSQPPQPPPPQSHLEKETKTTILQQREPLGLRQPLTQATVTTTAGAAIITSSSSSNTSVSEEDQENDISMASLGSDFVPSIMHDGEDEYGEHSFECEEEEEEEGEGITDLSSIRGGAIVDDGDDFEDDDFENDEELQMELSQAFRQHDESQLFKSVVYMDDIQSYVHGLERDLDLRPLPNYMDFQKDIDSEKRAILINWLVEVSDEYNLQAETLFICVGIIDRFLSKMSIPTNNFQLLGVAAMFIASKYEEIYPPNLYQFVEVTDDTYSGHQIRQMEQEILKTLNFRISLPTISFFLRQIFAYNKFSKKVYHLAEYLCYLSLLDDHPFLEYYPSEIAIAAVILAANQLDAGSSISSDLKSAYDKSNLDQLQRRTLPKNAKSRDIERRSYIIDKNLPFCIESLRTLQQRAFSRSSHLNTDVSVINKFSSESHSQVAFLQPPQEDDLFMY